jgi:hypothetical protein
MRVARRRVKRPKAEDVAADGRAEEVQGRERVQRGQHDLVGLGTDRLRRRRPGDHRHGRGRQGGRQEAPEIKEVCKKKTTGKGKAKKTENVCEMVDSNPKLTASLGIASLTKGFEWGMSPDAVLAKLGESINKGFDDQLKETKDPMGQDRIRKERSEQINELKKGNVKFTGNAKHKWGVSA